MERGKREMTEEEVAEKKMSEKLSKNKVKGVKERQNAKEKEEEKHRY